MMWVQCQVGNCGKVYDRDAAKLVGRRDLFATPCCGRWAYFDGRCPGWDNYHEADWRRLSATEVADVEAGRGHVLDSGKVVMFEVVGR